jgi:steroid 5-alpha reductase family enzyme
MPALADILLTNLGVLLCVVTPLWLLSLALRDASIVDIFWGMGFVILVWSTRLQVDASPYSLPLAIATTLWGLRLAAYLAARNLGHGEDRRYAAMRAARPRHFWWWSFLAIFLFQAVLCLIVGLPVQVGQALPRPAAIIATDILGAAIFLFGFLYETIADWQLARFKRDPLNAGRVMDRGLWRHSRHPNYFGEAILWWGLWLMATAATNASWTAVGPALITFLLLRVSGVSLLEKTIVHRRPEYAEYIRRTRAFIPGPRKP